MSLHIVSPLVVCNALHKIGAMQCNACAVCGVLIIEIKLIPDSQRRDIQWSAASRCIVQCIPYSGLIETSCMQCMASM